MNIPDWLWRELVGNAVWEIPTVLVPLAWKYRKAIMNTLGLKPERRVINLQPLTLHADARPVHISAASGASGGATANILHTPSLARRLEELISWYLHVS